MKKIIAVLFNLISLFFIGCNSSKMNKGEKEIINKSIVTNFDYEGHRGCRGLMPENTIPTTKRLWGHFEYSFDDKGRLLVPQKFRDIRGDKFVLTMGPDHHIRAFSLGSWNTIEERLCQYDMFDELTEDVLMIQRLYGSSAEVESDSQGRCRAWLQKPERRH